MQHKRIYIKVAIAFILLTTAILQKTAAQLCFGSLGDPVAHISFGSSENVISIAGNTTYRSGGSCPNDGEYNLPSITFDCFNGTWHTVVADHTGNDVSGRMMLVNASIEPGVFYVDTVTDLCPGTSYEFSAWVMNMLRTSACNGEGIDPNLTFKISTLAGVELATFNTGNIFETMQPTWNQYGLFFQPPLGVTTIVFRIINNAPGGCGNDLMLDDITFRACGPNIVVSSLTGSTDLQVCEDDPGNLVLKGSFSAPYSNPRFQWQVENNGVWVDIPGANSLTYSRPPTSHGYYSYRLGIADPVNFTTPACRTFSSPLTIWVEKSPDAQLTNYVYGCFGGEVVLFAAGGSTYHWTGPNGFTSDKQSVTMPNIQFTDAGQYKIRVTTSSGCHGYDSMNLVIYPAATAVIGPAAAICEGDNTTLFADGGLKYSWRPSVGLSRDDIPNPIATPKDSTVYFVTVTNSYGCTDTKGVAVHVWKKPKVHAGPDKRTRPGIPVQLEGSMSGTSLRFSWTPTQYITGSTTLRPMVSPQETTTYTLAAESSFGCGISSDQVFVRVYNRVTIPNAFSPNGDGINDTWVIEPLDLFPESITDVYNRYGQLVYQSRGYDKPWDGRRNGQPLPVGTYYYIIDLKTKEPPLTGSLLIMR